MGFWTVLLSAFLCMCFIMCLYILESRVVAETNPMSGCFWWVSQNSLHLGPLFDKILIARCLSRLGIITIVQCLHKRRFPIWWRRTLSMSNCTRFKGSFLKVTLWSSWVIWMPKWALTIQFSDMYWKNTDLCSSKRKENREVVNPKLSKHGLEMAVGGWDVNSWHLKYSLCGISADELMEKI